MDIFGSDFTAYRSGQLPAHQVDSAFHFKLSKIMLNITYRLVLSFSCLLCLCGTGAVNAAETAPTNLPANLKPLDESIDPVIAPHKSGENESHTTTQNKQSGTSTEVIVNSGSSTYSVKPNQTSGNVTPGEVQSSSNHPAQWSIFSWGKAKPAEPATESATPPEMTGKP